MSYRKITYKILEEFGLPAENIQQCTTDLLIAIGLSQYLDGVSNGVEIAQANLSELLYEAYNDEDSPKPYNLQEM